MSVSVSGKIESLHIKSIHESSKQLIWVVPAFLWVPSLSLPFAKGEAGRGYHFITPPHPLLPLRGGITHGHAPKARSRCSIVSYPRASLMALRKARVLSVMMLNFFSLIAFLSTNSPPAPRAVAPALMKAPAFCRFTPPVGT